MLANEDAEVLVEQLSAMRFFPPDPGGRVAVQRLLQRFCDSFERGQWLVDRMADLYAEWPGPVELRAVYCSRFRPADGLEADSQVYGDGIPAAPERKMLAGAERKRLQ